MAEKLIMGDRFIESLQKTGLLPSACTTVTITASVGEPVVVDYQTFGDERLLAVDAVETENPGEAVAK